MTADRRRAVIYTRISRDREGLELGVERQERDCRELAEQRGLEVVGVFRDNDISASTRSRKQRPGYRQMLADAAGGGFDVIVAYTSGRLTRRPRESEDLIELAEDRGTRFEYVRSPSFDLNTSAGRRIARILAANDAGEAEDISERVRRKLQERRENGLTTGGPPPFGYRLAAEQGRPHVPDPASRDAVTRMYAEYLAGRGPQTMVAWLNAEGHRTSRGHEFGVSTVARLLDSGYAAGYLPTGERGVHEAIVTEETWQAYRAERERRAVMRPKMRRPRWHLGSGLTRCALCGSNLVLSSYREPDPARRWYPRALCTRHNGTRQCKGVSIARHLLDGPVSLWLLGHLRELADRASERRDVDDERDRVKRRLAELRAEEEKILLGLRSAADLVVTGEMPREDYRAARRRAETRLRALADEAGELRAELDVLDPGRDLLDRFERDTRDLGTEEWHGLLRRVIKVIEVGPDQITIVPWRGEPAVYPRRPSTHARTQARRNGRFVRSEAS